jgi:putative FmdB family regulatory protein
MPTYDYECKACGHAFDELQSFSEPPLTKCPACKKNKLERLFGGGGAIIFKGSGFYETDYRRAGTNGTAKSEGEGGGTKSETKTETASGTGGDSASTSNGTPAAGKTGDKAGAKKKG